MKKQVPKAQFPNIDFEVSDEGFSDFLSGNSSPQLLTQNSPSWAGVNKMALTLFFLPGNPKKILKTVPSYSDLRSVFSSEWVKYVWLA